MEIIGEYHRWLVVPETFVRREDDMSACVRYRGDDDFGWAGEVYIGHSLVGEFSGRPLSFSDAVNACDAVIDAELRRRREKEAEERAERYRRKQEEGGGG